MTEVLGTLRAVVVVGWYEGLTHVRLPLVRLKDFGDEASTWSP